MNFASVQDIDRILGISPAVYHHRDLIEMGEEQAVFLDKFENTSTDADLMQHYQSA